MRPLTKPNRNLTNGFLTAVVGATLLVTSSSLFARSTYLTEFEFVYPGSDSALNAQCALCHEDYYDGVGYNPYGNDFRNASGRTIEDRYRAIESNDSDGDECSSSNLDEINASTQPGWKIGDSLPAGLDLTDEELDPCNGGGTAPIADPNGPYFGTTNVALTFDGSGSSDEDGTVVSYEWDFGDGASGTGATPSHTYTAGGVYDVTLTVTDNDGLTSEPATTTADINDPPVADANGPYSGTVDTAVNFDGSASSDSDGVIESYDWDFGDGSTGIGVAPSHVYDTADTYDVTLTVTDNDGASDTAGTTAVIDELIPPVADANGPYAGIRNEPVQFDGSGSSDQDGTIESYAWDFGDGNTGTGVDPTHAYDATGTYDVSLTVTDNDGLQSTDQTEATISIGDVAPVADANGPYTGVIGEAVQFDGTGSSDLNNNIDTYDWDFGDDTVALDAGPTPTHAYAAASIYTVTLTVTDTTDLSDSDSTTATIVDDRIAPVADPNGPYHGTAGEPVAFDGSDSSDEDGSVVAWNWDFGDDSTDTGETPSHTYAAEGDYTVTLIVEDNDGLVSEPATTTATIVPPDQIPVADPNGPYTGVEGREVNFDGTASYDPDGGDIVSYAWDFDDGSTGIGPTPTHIYATAGNYDVTLVVTDDEGQVSDPASTEAAIDIDQPPVALTDGPYTEQIDQQPVVFDGSDSYDPDGSIVAWDWDFGDGNTGSGETTSHTYEDIGTYTVTLTVTDDFDNTGITETEATITEPTVENPVADAGGPYTGIVNQAVDFNGSASTDPDGRIVRYDWNFGDGTVLQDAGATPSHTYTAPNVYNVVLTVTDDDGLSDSDNTTATIEPEPTGADVSLVFLNVSSKIVMANEDVNTRVIRAYGDSTEVQEATVTLTVDAPEGVDVQVTGPNPITDTVEPGRPYTKYFFDVSIRCEAKERYMITWTTTIDAAENSDPTNDTLSGETELMCIWGNPDLP